jgi:hypothetical protein
MCSLSLSLSASGEVWLQSWSLKARPDIVCLGSRGSLVAKLELNVLYVLFGYVLYVRLLYVRLYVLYCYKVMLTIKTLLKKVVQKVPKILLFFLAEHPRPPIWPSNEWSGVSAPHMHVRPSTDHHNVHRTSDRTLYHSLITTCVARVDPRPPLQTPHGASLSPPLAADTSYEPIDG